jgi:glycosyltransferase involved in cell wall biosynthesis
MKVVVATGPGKLHFMEAAAALARTGAEVNLLSGWVPSRRQGRLADVLGSLIGEKQLAKRLAVRRMEEEGLKVTANGWAEAVGTGLGLAGKLPFVAPGFAGALAFAIHGFSSRKHLDAADLFWVRSGAGRGGALRAARANGLKIIADHSIAHPAFMKHILTEEYSRFGMICDITPESIFWRGVLRDCQEADRVLVNSDFVKDTFVQNGFTAETIDVVYWGVRRDFLHLKKDYRRGDTLRVLFTGHFDLRKGARILLEAVRLVRRRGIDARLQVVGKMGTGQPCIVGADAEFLNLTPFMPQDELKELLVRSDLFVFPTLAEGCSRSAMEAAGAGLAVITTKNCGLPSGGQTCARYVAAGDVPALAEAIEDLGSNEYSRAALGRGAADFIADHFSWDHYGETVFRTFEGVVGRVTCASVS